MSQVIIFDRWKVRRGTAANLAAVNEVPLEGELIFEMDTGRIKFGDGVTNYNSLDYLDSDSIPYDNTDSDLTAADVKAALDELDAVDAAIEAELAEKLEDAPSDGSTYGRQDGAWVPVSGGGGGAIDPSTTAEIVPFDDFTRTPTATGKWVPSTLNGGTVAGTGEATAPGICRLTTGTSSAGLAAIAWGDTNTVIVGGGQIEVLCRFRLSALSDGTNTYFCQLMGLLNSWAGSATQRIYAAYPSPGGSLRLFSRNSGVDVTDDCSTVLAAATWYWAKLVINAAGTAADLYLSTTLADIDDHLEASISTTLTTSALRAGSLIGKSVGSTSRDLDLDCYSATQALTTPR